MRFTYRSGQRPLDGYQIKRGVGAGGFGEVYLAVSDGGKEVALKLLKGHTEIELRGVANCLNLKHPNLVHVYDLRSDDHGDKWLVMEYVSGESLSQVINRHPNGLPVNLAKEWFLNLARAVGYLHDHGVVHRDIKPANIFVENGTLKVGDYGLCKSVHSNQRQTREVGTVHYMAPEVGSGNYNKSIDIYACGIVLYELLTGILPFDGESDAEILMKHLSSPPDVSKAPPAFRPILMKSLDKNPARRYASMADLARAVEAASLPTASPAAVPIVAPVPNTPVAIAPPPLPPIAPPPAAAAPVVTPVAPAPVAAALPLPMAKPASGWAAFRDRLGDVTGGLVKAPFVAALALIPYAVVAETSNWGVLAKVFLMTALVSAAMLVGAGGAPARASDGWARRFRLAGLGVLLGALAFWLDGWPVPRVSDSESLADGTTLFGYLHFAPETFSVAVRYVLYFGLVLGVARWWKATARDRKDRFSLFPPLVAAFWGGALLFLWPWESANPLPGAIVPLVLATVAVQAVSPWSPPPPPAPKKLRDRPA